jgi:hypothetical protein
MGNNEFSDSSLEETTMKRTFSVLGLLGVAVLAGGLVMGDDKDARKDAKGLKSGKLPVYYSRLGLSDDQKKKIQEIQSEYLPKIQELEDQIKALKKKERAAVEEILTDAQRARLREILLEKAPGEREKKSPGQNN